MEKEIVDNVPASVSKHGREVAAKTAKAAEAGYFLGVFLSSLVWIAALLGNSGSKHYMIGLFGLVALGLLVGGDIWVGARHRRKMELFNHELWDRIDGLIGYDIEELDGEEENG